MAKQQASIEDLQSKMRNLNNEIEQIIQFCRKETLSMKYKKSFEEKESFCIKKIRLAKLCSKHTLICSKVERKILERTTTIYTILQLDIRINPKTFFKPLQFKCMYADLANETVILHYRSTNHVEGSLIITRKIFIKADYFLVYMYIDIMDMFYFLTNTKHQQHFYLPDDFLQLHSRKRISSHWELFSFNNAIKSLKFGPGQSSF